MATPKLPDYDLTEEDKQAFLAEVEAHKDDSVALICKRLDRGFARKHIRQLRASDPDFDNDYRNARGYGNEQVTNTFRKLAVEGVEEPIVSAGKLVRDDNGNILYKRVWSDRLVELAMKSYIEEVRAMEMARKGGVEINFGKGSVEIQSGVSTDDVLKLLQEVKGVRELEAPEGTGEVVDERDEPAGA